MDKIFIKPTAKEIMVKGSDRDGSSDLFSYDYSDPAQRGLGHLYVVGNIQAGQAASADDLDVGYVINLVASLAKREYYSKPDIDPKDAFGASLKKINGVIEEFFKHKDTKINIGIFALAGSNLHISKLGKFKIFLARDGSNIDILNNVDLFKKESTQEKQFSNIISGMVSPGDRLLAFYPSRAMVARERQLKASLLDLNQEDFAKKLESVKDDKNDFCCAAVHVELNKSKEPATAPKIQPKELAEESSEIPSVEVPEVAPVAVQLASEKEESKPAPKIINPEVPKIIPAEFSLGKKANPLSKYTRQFKNVNFTPKSRLMVFGSGVAALVLAVVVLKSFVFVDASARALSDAASQASSNIQAAREKANQNDLLGAHSLLLSSLASINEAINQNGSSDKADSVKNDIIDALDELEQAQDASVSAAEGVDFNSLKNIPDSLSSLAGQYISAYLYADNLYGLTGDEIVKVTDATKGKTATSRWLTGGTLVSDSRLVAVDGDVFVLSGNGILTIYYTGEKKNEFSTPVYPGDNSVILTTDEGKTLYVINKSLGRIYAISKLTGALERTLKLNSDSSVSEAAITQDGVIYVLIDDKVWRVN